MAPISVSTSLSEVTSIAFVVLENPNVLAAYCRIPAGTIQQGKPVWEVLARHLAASRKPLDARPDGITLQNVTGNPGLAEQG